MNLESNGSKAIAILVVINAGLFISHQANRIVSRAPVVNASIASTHGEMCKAQAEARIAAMQARMQAREAARQASRAQKQIQRDAKHASAAATQSMAPTASRNNKVQTTVTDYVRCIVSSGVRSIMSGS
jgi:hypothetical protein